MIKLCETVDKTGEAVEIWYANKIGGTPALPLFLRVYAEIVEKGFATSLFMFSDNDQVVWAQRPNGKVIGGISFEYQPEKRCGFLVLSFTDPNERGKGINELCHSAYESQSKEHGAVFLQSIVHVDNTSRIKSAAKVGMMPKYLQMYKKI
jgi:RimJ/RimL family protein N-acetyltransferase